MINRFKWLEVAAETRKNIIVFLSDVNGFPPITRSGYVEVAGNRVVCDGFTDQDLCAITPELLRAAMGEHTLEHLENKDDVYALFYELVGRLEGKPVFINPMIDEPVETPKAKFISPEDFEHKQKAKKSNDKK
jgi:hypothetical protein